MKNKFKPQYSGNRSRKIWDTIHTLTEWKRRELYACFILLQDLEGSCLTWLNNYLENERKSK